jgi:hypothetical protein
MSGADELRTLQKLHSAGALTDEEFAQAQAAVQADRPLTTPLLVRGSLLDPCLFVLCLGYCAIVLPILWTIPSLLTLALAAVAALIGPVSRWLWLLRRRRWLEVAVEGFAITEKGRRQRLTDEQVSGVAWGCRRNQAGFASCRLTFEIAGGPRNTHAAMAEPGVAEAIGGVRPQPAGRRYQRITCAYDWHQGRADPLEPFRQRLIAGLCQRTCRDLAAGAELRGCGWRLAATGVHYRRGLRRHLVPLHEVTWVHHINGLVCLWQGNQERPFLSLADNSLNALTLLGLVPALRQGDPLFAAPPAERPLGRQLFRLSGWWWPVLGLALFFLILPLLALLPRDEGFRILAAMVLIFLTLPLLALVGVNLLHLGRYRLSVHTDGIVQHNLWGRRQLLYSEIGTLVWGASSCYCRLLPREGSDLPAIQFVVTDALVQVRDMVSQRIAGRWAERLQRGEAVEWTPSLTFRPEGLECLFSRGPAKVVPYPLISYRWQDPEFLLYAPDASWPVLKNRTDGPNFFPGLVLLGLLYRQHQQPPEGPETALPSRQTENIRTPAQPPAPITALQGFIPSHPRNDKMKGDEG